MNGSTWRESDWSHVAIARTVFEAVEPVAQRFRDEGHDLYLVGGIVRDLMLAKTASANRELFNDIDLTTDAMPDVTAEIVRPMASALWTQGERFGTIGATIAEHDLEITTYRAESYEPESRKPVVAFGDDLNVDLSRRDFSINAMAIDAGTGELIDPFGGATDLERRLLRTPLDPSISFTDDPLRMMRAARFIPRFGLDVDPALSAAVIENASRLSIVSAERIHDEFERLLALPSPKLGLTFLVDTGLLAEIAPELAVDRWDLAASRVACGDSSLVRRAAFCATIGEGAEAFIRNRRYSAAKRQLTLKVCAEAQALVDRDALATSDDPTLRRLAHVVGLDQVAAVLDTSLVLGAPGNVIERLAERLSELASLEDLTDFSAPVAGGEIIELMGLSRGPAVGAVVDRLFEHRLEHGPLSADETRALLRSWR